jgi:hypothetical protein
MSATSSAQSHGGARRVDCRSQLLRFILPERDAGERPLVASIGAPRMARSVIRPLSHQGSRSPVRAGLRFSHRRVSAHVELMENDSHAL